MVLLPVSVLVCLPSIPQIFKSMITVLMAPLVASMTCRVYRNIKLFEYDTSSAYPISEIQFL